MTKHKHLKETLAEMQMMHTASRIVDAGLIDFSANLSDLGDMVVDLTLPISSICGNMQFKDPRIIESVHKTASALFACQQQIDAAISATKRIQSIIEEFENIDFPE